MMEPLTLENNRFQCFLYLLLRDHLPAGEIEQIIRQCEEATGTEITYSNPHLAMYSQNLAARLNQ